MKKQLPLLALMLAGCAAGPNPIAHTAGTDGSIAGFWLGLWHGLICPTTFIISLFSDNVHFYEVHNSGGWYNFGFFWEQKQCSRWKRCQRIEVEKLNSSQSKGSPQAIASGALFYF